MRSLNAAAFGLFFLLSVNSAAAQQVGDVIVVVQPAKLMVRDEPLETIHPGTSLKVLGLNGDWLWVSHETAGWINRENVANLNQAIDIFTEHIRQNPDDSAAYVRRGNVWFAKEEFEIALGDYSDAIRLDPKSPSAYHNRGNCWLAMGRINHAISDYSEAIRLNPNSASLLYSRAIAWAQKKELEKAIADYTEAIKINPRFSRAYCNRGSVWRQLADFGKAVADYEESLKINPKSASAYDGLALVNVASTDPRFRDDQKAIENARKACQLTDWKNPQMLETLATAYAETRNFDQAVNWQAKATNLASETEKPKFRIRLDLFKAGKPYRKSRDRELSSQP